MGASVPLDDGELGGAARVEATFTGGFDEHSAIYLGYRLVGASLTLGSVERRIESKKREGEKKRDRGWQA